MQSNSIELKQNLLKTEIYDKGYDCDKFQEYMDQIKPNGGQDIEVWTVVEIMNAIREFQEHNQIIMHSVNLDDAIYLSDSKSQIDENSPLEEVVMKPQINDDRFYQRTVKCCKQEQRIVMMANDINTQILSYERVPGGIFTSAYYVYKIATEPLDWVVSRRYNDFLWLRDLLVKIYPGRNIPPMPKKSVIKNQQDLYLTKRMKFLERFLQAILHCELLKHDKWFVAFLSVREDKDIQHIQKLSQNIQRVSRLDSLYSLTGEVDLIINDNITNFNKESNALLSQMELLYKKIRKEAKQLLLDFDQTSNTIFNMGESFASLYKASNKFNQSLNMGKCPQLDVLYVTLNNMLVQWGNNITLQIQIVQDELCNFTKFQHQYTSTLKEFIKQKDSAYYEYDRYKVRLEMKKNKLFQAKDTQRWEVSENQIKSLAENDLLRNKDVCMALMLPKETQIEQELKNIYAYYNYQAYNETNQFLCDTIHQFAKHFIGFSKLECQNIGQMNQYWADGIINLQNFKPYSAQLIT